MYARIMSTDLKKATIDEAASEWQSYLRHYKNTGMKHAFMMVDRKTGKYVSVTVWESEEARQKNTSSPQHAAGRKVMVEKYFESPPSTEAFEVLSIIE